MLVFKELEEMIAIYFIIPSREISGHCTYTAKITDQYINTLITLLALLLTQY